MSVFSIVVGGIRYQVSPISARGNALLKRLRESGVWNDLELDGIFNSLPDDFDVTPIGYNYTTKAEKITGVINVGLQVKTMLQSMIDLGIDLRDYEQGAPVPDFTEINQTAQRLVAMRTDLNEALQILNDFYQATIALT